MVFSFLQYLFPSQRNFVLCKLDNWWRHKSSQYGAKHKMTNISANNSPMHLKLAIIMYSRKYTTWCIFWCCYGNTLGSSSLSALNQLSLFVTLKGEMHHSIPNIHNIPILLELPIKVIKADGAWKRWKMYFLEYNWCQVLLTSLYYLQRYYWFWFCVKLSNLHIT